MKRQEIKGNQALIRSPEPQLRFKDLSLNLIAPGIEFHVMAVLFFSEKLYIVYFTYSGLKAAIKAMKWTTNNFQARLS